MKIIDVKMTNLWYIAVLAVCDQWTGLLDWTTGLAQFGISYVCHTTFSL